MSTLHGGLNGSKVGYVHGLLDIAFRLVEMRWVGLTQSKGCFWLLIILSLAPTNIILSW